MVEKSKQNRVRPVSGRIMEISMKNRVRPVSGRIMKISKKNHVRPVTGRMMKKIEEISCAPSECAHGREIKMKMECAQ